MLRGSVRGKPAGGSFSESGLFIDGGHHRVRPGSGRAYDPDWYRENRSRLRSDESLLRNLYYDCAPYRGSPPYAGFRQPANFRGSDFWLRIAAKPQFAVRLGTLKFRGFVLKRPDASQPISDSDFKPRIRAKGRICGSAWMASEAGAVLDVPETTVNGWLQVRQVSRRWRGWHSGCC